MQSHGMFSAIKRQSGFSQCGVQVGPMQSHGAVSAVTHSAFQDGRPPLTFLVRMGAVASNPQPPCQPAHLLPFCSSIGHALLLALLHWVQY